MNSRALKRTALCIAMGACLATLSPLALAQSATGAVAGRASAGDQITVTNAGTGLSRTVTADADGSYRVAQLPVGDYNLQVTRNGQAVGAPIPVDVDLGGTTTVNLSSEGGIVNLAAVTVVGSQVINRVDVRSTESATNITREELSRLPVDQSLGSVALLAPGVIGGNSSFGGISFGGSSVAENSVFINGLNVTDFYRRQSFSSAPFAFFEEYQVKTGGYSVEFGRSTGGVINAVTRSGTNEFEGGLQLTFEPAAFRSEAKDRFYDDGSINVLSSRDEQSFTKLNGWASGPLVKDRAFLFAMYELRDAESRFTDRFGSSWSSAETNNGFWGTKFDWYLNDNHLLEFLAFSDEGETVTDTYAYDFDANAIGDITGSVTGESGGKNGSLTYTGYFGEDFVAKAMYGLNRSKALSLSPSDVSCDWIIVDSTYNDVYEAMGSPTLGCHPGATVVNHHDEREVGRLDFEWTLGDHLLRFGLDHEAMTTDRTTNYPGAAQMRYSIFAVEPGDELDNGAFVPAGVDAIVMGRRRIDGGVFETEANAYYLEDIWSITPNLLLNLGVRIDNFENKTAAGTDFIKLDDLVSPRFGFSWDMKGDGSTKLFGNLGRYYLPVTSNIQYTFAGGLIDERTFYELDGYSERINPLTGSPYLQPILGPQIGPVDDDLNIEVGDLRQSVDRDLDAVYQDEAILGFQSAISQAWSWGVNATYRKMTNALDDVRINHTPCGPIGFSLFPIANPGKPLTIWGDESIGCETEGWITIDTSRDGYERAGSGEVTGYFEPKRTYKAVEFQIDRAWDGKWAFNASYLWSKSDGNHEGPVNSDTNYGDTGMVQHWDHPANNDRYGPLFNDHRHQIKLRGSYELSEMWAFGATLSAQSGGPITAFGVTWPNDSRGAGSFVTTGSGGGSGYLCIENCDGAFNERVYRFTPRGEFGRLPWTYNLGANVTWTLPVPDVDLKARLSVFNLLNEQEVINVSQRYEAGPGVRRDTFATGTRWQSPRYMQLVVTWNF